MERPLAERRAALDEALAGAGPPVFTTPVHRLHAPGRALVPGVRGRRPRRGDRQAAATCPTWRTSGSCSRSSTSGPPTAWSPASAGTRRARWSARCCSGSTTRRASSSTSGCRPRSRWSGAASCWTSWPPTGWRRAPSTPGRGYSTPRADPGRAWCSRWNAKKDLSFELLRPQAGGRGGLRPHGGPALPPHRPVPALAPRPRPRVLHLRPARAAGRVRPGRHPGPGRACLIPGPALTG